MIMALSAKQSYAGLNPVAESKIMKKQSNPNPPSGVRPTPPQFIPECVKRDPYEKFLIYMFNNSRHLKRFLTELEQYKHIYE